MREENATLPVDGRRRRTRARSDIASAAASSLLDTRRLFYFFHVARTGSFTAAESHLDVAQSALSRQIRQLESDLDTKLLERRGHGVNLTTTGRVFYSYAEQILGTMGEALEEVHRSKQAPRDRVAIAAPRPFSTRFFPEVLLSYNRRFPHIHVTIREASSGQVYEMLTTGLVDLAVVLQQPNSPKVVGSKLFDEELLVAGRADDPMLNKKVMSRRDLATLNLMLPAAPLGTRGILERYFEGGGFSLDPQLRFDSVSLMKEMIRRGGHSAILPAMAFEAELESGEFVALPLKPRLHRTLHLAHLRDRRQTDALKAIREELLKAVHGFSRLGKT